MRISQRTLVAGVMALSSCIAAADPWSYESETDKMTGQSKHFATLFSDNSIDLPFPYSGANRGTLLIRQKAKGSNEVMFMIQKGQMMCRSYRPCTVSIRFDSKQPLKFEGTGNSSSDPTVTFIQSANTFVQEAKKAKKILVQVDLYQAGLQIFEFSPPTPLEWPAIKK